MNDKTLSATRGETRPPGVRLELRALREAAPALIEVVSWPAPLRTNPAEAGLAEPFSLLAAAPHAVEDVEGLPYHWTGAAENAPVLADNAPRRQFRKNKTAGGRQNGKIKSGGLGDEAVQLTLFPRS